MIKIDLLALAALTFGFTGLVNSTKAAAYTFTTLDDPLAVHGTVAQGVNNAGQIVGYYVDGNNMSHGFVYSAGIYTSLDNPLGTNTAAFGINNIGQIVGKYSTGPANNLYPHGFLYSGGTWTNIDYPVGSTGNVAHGINDNGAIIGQFSNGVVNQGFLFYANSYTIVLPPSGFSGSALGINNAGAFVGNYNFSKGFVDSGGVYTDIEYPSANVTYAFGINNNGEITGYYADTSSRHHGFTYDNGNFVSLNDPGAAGDTFALGINDLGQIVGSFVDANGADHGFLATPENVPGPTSLAVFTVGLTGILLTRKRKRA